MGGALARVRDFYGASALHLLALLACFALVGYVVAELGVSALWDPDVWWQSVIVWFGGAVLAHDFVLFPLYALADRSYGGALRVLRARGAKREPAAVPALNHVRVPVLATGLLFLLFFPGIIEQGQASYAAATGQTQEPYLERWLLLSGAFFALSAVAYAVRRCLPCRHRRP